MKKLARHFIPNLGTLIILGLFLFAQAVGAFPLKGVKTQGATLPGLINYQGRLTDADGNSRHRFTRLRDGRRSLYTFSAILSEKEHRRAGK